jgi:hypothetical protein
MSQEIYVDPINTFSERVNPTVLNFLFDISYSMMGLLREGIVSDAMNEVMIPGLQGAWKLRQMLLRTALGGFSADKIYSLTKKPGYHKLAYLMKNPVEKESLIRDGVNGETALFMSMMSGIHHAVAGAEVVKKASGCRRVSVKVVVPTDGSNTVNNATPADVKRTIRNVPAFVDLTVHWAYFKTQDGLAKEEFKKIGAACGLREKDCHFWSDHGTDIEQQRKAFRALVEILSKEVAQ